MNAPKDEVIESTDGEWMSRCIASANGLRKALQEITPDIGTAPSIEIINFTKGIH